MSRADRYRSEIQLLILSKLSVARVRELRQEYLAGGITIADLSLRTDVPPVLLWALLTPLYERTHIKYKLLQLESKIYSLRAKGESYGDIAAKLCISDQEVKNYTEDRFSSFMYQLRPWYTACEASVYDDEDRWSQEIGVPLPPASRIGLKAGEIKELPPEKIGRCSICGKKVHMPCYACAVREYLKNNKVPRAESVVDALEEGYMPPPLMFR